MNRVNCADGVNRADRGNRADRADRTARHRRLAAVLLILALAALGAAVPGAVPAAEAQTTGAFSARIGVSALGPALIEPTTKLTVTGRVTNTGTLPLQVPTVRLRLVRTSLGTPVQVANWQDGTDQRTGFVVGPTVNLSPADIAPGITQPFTLTVAGTELGLGGQPFGAYGLTIEVRAQGSFGRQQIALLRTTIQWQPGRKEYAAQQISWLVPISAAPMGPAGANATPEQVAGQLGPQSRLRRLLQAASAPGVAWALDPALLETLQRAATGAGEPAPEPGAPAARPDPAARAAAAAFLADLRAAARDRVVIELPYADPDLAAVTAGLRPDLVQAAQAAGAGILTQVLGVTPVTGVALPAQGWASDATLGVLAAAGARDVVLDERYRPLVDALPYTSDARADLNHGLTGWLADSTLSELAGSAVTPDPLRVQRFLAETASVTSERPGLTRRLLVVAPRGFDPDPAAFRALVDATAGVPWLGVVPVTALDGPPTGNDSGDTAPLQRMAVAAPPGIARAQLAPAHVAAVRRLRTALSALGEVVASPSTVTDGLQRSTLDLLSCSWRGQPRALALARARVGAQVRALSDDVRVLPSSVNFLTSSGRLQITVANGLPVQARGLRLRVTSTNPRLRVREGDVVAPDLAPGTRAQIQVPVQAIASGVVLLQAQLLAPSGRPVGSPVQVQVRVQPTDTWALWVLGAVAALVLVVGLARALRRPRRARVQARRPT